MCGHPHGQIRQGREGPEINIRQGFPAGRDNRQLKMAVDPDAAMTWHMLDHRQDTAPHQASRLGAAQTRHQFRVRRKGPIADDVMPGGIVHIQAGHAINVDTKIRQFQRHKAGVQGHRFHRRRLVYVGKAAKFRRRGNISPLWRR